MLKKLADIVGKGWKAYVAGFGLICYAIAVGIDSTGIDVGGLNGEWSKAVEMFLLGLATLGIRSKQDDEKQPVIYGNRVK